MADDLQSIINAQIKDGVGGGVSLPKGEFVVNDTLEVVRVRGFKFGGQGSLVTQLRWTGPDDRCATSSKSPTSSIGRASP